jgi:S1-C subfamily serine protease
MTGQGKVFTMNSARRWILYVSVMGLCFPAPMFSAQDWSAAVDLLAKSTVYIEVKGGSCTGFVASTIERDGDKYTRIATAAHCDGEQLYADQTPAKVVFKDTKRDLMVIETENLDRPSLKLAAKDPRIGDSVGSYGFGYSLERPMFRVAHVSDDKTYIATDGIGGPLLVIDAAFVGGQSGGPIVNALGEVVMIVQLASDRVGLGVGVETIRSKIGRFFTK